MLWTINLPFIGYSFLERYVWMCSMRFCSSRSWRLLIRLAHVALPVFFHCHCSRILWILSFNFGQEWSSSIPEITVPSIRRQAPTDAKEFSSRAIIRLMLSKSRSWHCNSANFSHASSLNMGGRSMTDLLLWGCNTRANWIYSSYTVKSCQHRGNTYAKVITHMHSRHAWGAWSRSDMLDAVIAVPDRKTET